MQVELQVRQKLNLSTISETRFKMPGGVGEIAFSTTDGRTS
jgi:hypothetical protein